MGTYIPMNRAPSVQGIRIVGQRQEQPRTHANEPSQRGVSESLLGAALTGSDCQLNEWSTTARSCARSDEIAENWTNVIVKD